jgi:hypothetical protein
LQQVEHVRPDVTIVTAPLLSAAWYREEISRRTSLLDRGAGSTWSGTDATIVQIRARAALEKRPVVISPLYGE